MAKIIDYLVSNATKYYDKDALVADPDFGTILSSLLVGPCALDYSRTKSVEHFWSDPPADELVSTSNSFSSYLRIKGWKLKITPAAKDWLDGKNWITVF